MEIGAFTFADVAIGSAGNHAARRIPELIEEIALADEVGLDVFGIGEHHRAGYAATTPAVILAAAAARTQRIRLTSAVTVLSSDDPVRVFEQFAALDLVSSGRAEIMAGRGAFADTFRLFGPATADHDALFEEKVALLRRLRDHERVTWSGRYRPALVDEPILPRPAQRALPIWIAVGGSPSSAVRAGRLGLPMGIVMLGGHASHFVPLVEAYRSTTASPVVGVNLHGFIAPTSQRAADVYYPADTEVMNRVFTERGMRPSGRDEFDAKIAPEGVYAVGSPDQVAEKILAHHALFGHQRTMIQLAVGTVPHRDLMTAIELLGTEVAPVVRREVARRTTRDTPGAQPPPSPSSRAWPTSTS